jgi:ribosomal protein L11 methyltransferase
MNRSEPQFAWSKLVAAKWEEEWRETLRPLGETRLAVFALPGGKRIRLEFYGLTAKERDELMARYGGTSRALRPEYFLSMEAQKRPPRKIRDRLVIVESVEEAAGYSDRNAVIVPAGVAFGTGEHITTATCLRMLVDVANTFRERWEMLDLGTGSGILAISGRVLGAERVEALDFDPEAVRVARVNVQANRANGIVVKRGDVTKWEPKRTWQVVTANLFSRILIQAAPAISAAVEPDGFLIVSGILRSQEREVLDVFAQWVEVQRIVRSGKWVAVCSRRPYG